MSISFSGLASGLDTSSWVASLVALKQAPVTTLNEDKENALSLQETLSSIKSFFTSFRSMIEKVTDAKFGVASMDLFAQNLANSTNLDVLTASATTEAEEATYNVLVDKLASNTQANSNYSYMTTIIQTTTATLDSKLTSLGVKAGSIGVNVNGVQLGINITENDTLSSFIEKLRNIGVEASFNEQTGIFNINVGKNDIKDIDNTGIIDALHLNGVNEGYKSNDLKTEQTDTIYTPATEATLMKDLGVSAGVVTIRANDDNYQFTIAEDTTLGQFINALKAKNIDVELDATGVFTISDAEITAQGTTGIIDALGLAVDIYGKSQVTDKLTHQMTVTQATTATSETLLKDLGSGTEIADGQTVIVKNSNNEYTTITVGTSTTLGDLLEGLSNAGLYAALKSDGTVEIAGGTITGGTFDAVKALGLTKEPYSAMVTGKSLTEVVTVHKLVDLQTRLVDDLKVTEGYLEVTDADNNKYYEKIYSGQTIADFMTDMGNLGINTSLDEETGVLTITGGAFKTLTDADVLALVADGTIRETEARYKKGTNLLECLYGSGTISTDHITVASTYSKSQALRHSVTNTIGASLTTTLENLGLSVEGNAIFNVRGDERTIDVSKTSTIQDLIDALNNQGIAASWDSEHSKLMIENATLTGGTSNLLNVLGLTTTVSGKYVTSDNLQTLETITIDATRETILKDYGILNSMSIADRTVTFYNSDGSVAGSFVVTENTTIGRLMDFISEKGLSVSLENGLLTIKNGYIENATLEEKMGLKKSNKSSYVLGSVMTTTTVAAVTGGTKLGEIISTLGTTDKVRDGYSLAFNGNTIDVSENTTLNELISAIIENGGTASLDSTGRLSINGGTLTGTVAEALGMQSITNTASVSATGKTMFTTEEVFATRDTTFKSLGISDCSYTIMSNVIDKIGPGFKLKDTNTIGDFLDRLKKHGIDGTISNGVIRLISTKGSYIDGALATALGITTNTTTEVVNTTQGSTLKVMHTSTITADLTSTLGQIGAITSSSDTIKIFDENQVQIGEITDLTSDSTIADLFDELKKYGIIGTITDGVISLYSDSGRYAGGNIMDNLGISVANGLNVTFTIANTITSTAEITFTDNVKATEDQKISQFITLPTNKVITVKDEDNNDVATITITNDTTFGSLFAELSQYGIDGDIHDGVIKLTSPNGNYVTGAVMTALGISTTSETISTTVGKTTTSSAAISYTQVVGATDSTKISSVIELPDDKVILINDSNGVRGSSGNIYYRGIEAYTITDDTTFGDLFAKLAEYGIEAKFDNGQIKITNNGNFVTGDVITALGINCTNIPTTVGIPVSSSVITYTDITEATLDTKFGELAAAEIAAGKNVINIYMQNGESLAATYTVTADSTIGDLFNRLSSIFACSLKDGVITIDSKENFYIADAEVGGVLSALGISVNTTTRITGTNVTSTAAITYTQTIFADSSTKLEDLGVHGAFINKIDRMSEEDAIAAGYTCVHNFSEFVAAVKNTGAKIMLMNNISVGGSMGDFTGTLDGNGYKITGATGATNLFDNLGDGTIIRNLQIDSFTVSVEGAEALGLLANTATGNVTIQNSSVTNGYISPRTSTGNASYGMFIGAAEETDSGMLTMIECFASGTITGVNEDTSAGGLVGSVKGSCVIDNSATRVNFIGSYKYVGGIIGDIGRTGMITNVVVSGNMGVGEDSEDSVGVVVGHAYQIDLTEPKTSLDDVNAVGKIDEKFNIGALDVNKKYQAAGEALVIHNDNDGTYTVIDASTISTIGDFLEVLRTHGIEGTIENGVIKLSSTNGCYVTGNIAEQLDINVTDSSQAIIAGKAMQSDSIIRYTATVLATTSTTPQELNICTDANFVKGIRRMTQAEAEAARYTWVTTRAQLTTALADSNAKIMLGTNISLSGTAWTPIDTFSGILDGNGYQITSMTVSNTEAGNQNAGFIKYLNGGTVRNLGFTGASVTNSISSTTTSGYRNAGILAGSVSGATTDNCYVKDSTVILYSNGDVYNVSRAGGLYGADDIDVGNTTITNVNIINTNVTATGMRNISAAGIGGVLQATSLIQNCNVYGGIITAAGEKDFLGAFKTIGGLVAEVSGTIKDCKTSAKTAIAGATPDCRGSAIGRLASDGYISNIEYTQETGIDAFQGAGTNYDGIIINNNIQQDSAITIRDIDGNIVGTVPLEATLPNGLSGAYSLKQIFNRLTFYGITGTITNGVLECTSANGNYVTGSVADALGFRVKESAKNGEIATSTVVVTADTTFASLGVTIPAASEDAPYITVINNNKSYNFSITDDTTIDNFMTWLAAFDIVSTINADGHLVLNQTGTAYLDQKSYKSKDVLDALFGDNFISGKCNQMYMSGETLSKSSTVSITETTTLADLGIRLGTQEILVEDANGTHTITMNSTNILGDLISELAEYGLTASVRSGRFCIDENDNAYILNAHGFLNPKLEPDLFSKLQIEVGENYSYGSVTKTFHTNTDSSSLYDTIDGVTITSSTTLGELGLNENGTIEVVITSAEYSATQYIITVNDSHTIDDLITTLAGYGISGSIIDGKLSLTGTVHGMIRDMSSNLGNIFNFTVPYDYTTTYTVFENTTSDKLGKATVKDATTSTKMSELGLIIDGTIKLGGGSIVCVSEDMTIGDMFTALAAHGFQCDISDGIIKIAPSSDEYIAEISSNLEDILNIISGENKTYRCDVIFKASNTDSSTLLEDKVTTLTTSSTLASLGVTENSTVTVVNNSTQYTVTFTSDQTIDDVISALAGYGIAGSVKDGKLTLTGTKDGFILGMSDTIKNALKLAVGENNTYVSTEHTIYKNNASNTLAQDITTTLTTDTTFAKLGMTNNGIITVVVNGTEHYVTVSPDKTIDDLISTIAGFGISGSVADGKLTFAANNGCYIKDMSENVKNALKLVAGQNNSWKTENGQTWINTDSDKQDYIDNVKITGDTIISSINGYNGGNGSLIVHKTDGTYVTISVDASKTLDEFFEQISQYGLVGSIDSEGKVTITGVGNVYLQAADGGSNILSALNLSNVAYNVKTVTVNRTSNTLKETITVAATGTTTLENLADKDGNSITFTGDEASIVLKTYSDAGNQFVTLNFSKTQSIYDVIDELAKYGINATLDASGRFSVSSSTLNDFEISGALGNFLMGSYSKEYGTDTTYNISTNLVQQTIAYMNDSTLLSKFGVTGGNILITQEGVNYTVNIDTTTIKTVGDFRDLLAQYGFTSFIDDQGRLNVTGIGNSYLSTITGGSNIIDKFGLTDWTLGEITQQSDHLTDTETLIKSVTMQTKISELTNDAGVNLGITAGQIYVYQDGTRSTLNIDTNDTLETLAAKLSQYGITLGISQDGKLYFDGNNNSYLTTDGIASANASNILEKIGVQGNWATRYDSTSKNLEYTEDTNKVINGSTKLSDLQDADGNNLGITTGAYYIYSSGVRNTETITADMTINDFMATLAKYGLIADIAEDGSISVGAYNNTYLATSALGAPNDNSNVVTNLFAKWDFVNIYTSNGLDIPTDEVRAITRDTKLSSIREGAYQEGYITIVKDGVQTDIKLNADDTVGTFMDELALYGFEAVLNDNGQLIIKNTGDSLLQNYTGSEQASNILDIMGIGLNNWVSTNTYKSSTLDVVKTSTIDAAATRDTKLSELGVTTGEYYVYNNGVKYTALISSDETLGSFMETLKSFGLETSIVTSDDGTILSIIGKGNSYITKSASANASNVVEKLFTDTIDETKKYTGKEETSSIKTTLTSATEDTLLSYFDKNGKVAAGDLSVAVNGITSIIKIDADETFASLLEKFRALGLEATMSNGKIMIQSGFNSFTINSNGTDSGIMDTIGLIHYDDLGGYASSNDTVKSTTTSIEERTLSVSNYAGESTQLGLLNISAGSLTVYRDGQKAQIQLSETDTFGDLRSKLSGAFADVELEFNDGYLRIYSKNGANIEIGSTTDSTNFNAITGIANDGSGSVVSARELYCVNSDSTVTQAGLFRRGQVTEGTFKIGDATFTITNTTKLADLISQINSSEAANATAFWDNIDGKFVIKSRTTGAALVNIEAGTSNFTDIMGFTTSEWDAATGNVNTTKMNINNQVIGDNAKIKINGTTYTSTSNNITSDVTRIKGLTINLKGLTEGTAVTLTVERDKETLANAISDVVDSYNELMKNVDEAIAKDGKLHSETTLKLIRNQLRNMMTSSDAGTTIFRNLDSIGIAFNAASGSNIATTNDAIVSLNFDKDKFIKAYEADQSAVKDLLIGGANNKGIFTKVEDLVESSLQSVSGYFATTDSSYTKEAQKIETKIVKATKDIEKYRARLEAKFSAMDMLIAQMQQQYSSFLTT